jgi:hypothetical protein
LRKPLLAALFLIGAVLLFRFATRIEIDLVVFFAAACVAALYFAGSFQRETGSPATLGTISQQLSNLYFLVAAISQIYPPDDGGNVGTADEDLETRSRRREHARLRRAAQSEELITLLQRDLEQGPSVHDANDNHRLQFWGHLVTLAALASGKTPDEALGATNDAWDKYKRWIGQHEGERIRNECNEQWSLDTNKHKTQSGHKACPECEGRAQAAEKSFLDHISLEK